LLPASSISLAAMQEAQADVAALDAFFNIPGFTPVTYDTMGNGTTPITAQKVRL
jgi:hypothetical protein